MEIVSSVYEKVPRGIRQFLLRAIIVFVAWQGLYRFVLVPARIPDRQLTNVTCFATTGLLSVFYDGITPRYVTVNTQKNALIVKDGNKMLAIADPCNALDLYVLYGAFLFCYPGGMRRRFAFLGVGLAAIFVANIVRCALIGWLSLNHKEWVDISHHFIFTTLMYLFIFYGWVLYTKKVSDAG